MKILKTKKLKTLIINSLDLEDLNHLIVLKIKLMESVLPLENKKIPK